MYMNRQTVGFCHPWNCRLGLDDDNLRDGRFPSPSDKSLETDMQDDTRALVVEEGVGLVQRLTMERERETAEGPRQRWTQGDGGTRSTQRFEVHLSCRDRSCCRWWLVVARQPRIPTDVTCGSLKDSLDRIPY